MSVLTWPGVGARKPVLIVPRSANASADGAGVDETAYYRALREAVLTAQPVDEAALQELAAARAEAIRALLVDEAGVGPDRVHLLDPVPVEPATEKWVRLDLDIKPRD